MKWKGRRSSRNASDRRRQCVRWFNKGLRTGEMETGNTFEGPWEQL